MTNVQSKIVTCSCQEFVHPWTDSCVKAVAGFLIHGSMHSLKMYGTVYAMSMFISRKVPRKDDIKQMLSGIIRSASFLTTNGALFFALMCLWKRVFGYWTFFGAAFWPAFYGSVLAYIIERPSRRILLTMYVLNEACETVWNMLQTQGYVTPIKYSQNVLFGLGMSMLLFMHKSGIHKKRSLKDSIFGAFNLVLGEQEEGPIMETCDENKTGAGNSSQNLNILTKVKEVLESKHRTCAHKENCISYTFLGGLKPFLGGVSISLFFKLISSYKRKTFNISNILFRKDIYNLGLFLGGFSFLYKGSLCVMRHLNDCDKPKYAVISALVASTSSVNYKSNFVSLYILLKALQMYCYWGCEENVIPTIKHSQIVLYATATAILFHAAMYLPMALRPSYWKFLFGLSGSRVVLFNRQVLEHFGLKSHENLLKMLQRTNTFGKPLKWSML